MSVSIVGNTSDSTCTGCCSGTGTGTCTCQPCPVCRTDLLWITITAATGKMLSTWFNGVTGYTALPFSVANPFTDGSVEVCGGLVTSLSISAYCADNAVCLTFQFGVNRDSGCDVSSETGIHIYDGCTAGTSGDVDATVSMGSVVCDAFGFVSIDFTADCGADGTFSGTISR